VVCKRAEVEGAAAGALGTNGQNSNHQQTAAASCSSLK
jgi:hypothetical protein